MPARRPREWWIVTRRASISAAVLLLAAVAGATALGGAGPIPFAGVDLAVFGAVVLLPFVLAFAVWRHALWQDTADRSHSMSGDG